MRRIKIAFYNLDLTDILWHCLFAKQGKKAEFSCHLCGISLALFR